METANLIAPADSSNTATSRTVFSVPLAPDERVLYFKRIPRDPLISGIIGVALVPVFFVGAFVIRNAIRMREYADWAQVITNKRVFAVDGLGGIRRQMAWSDVEKIYSFTYNGALQRAGVRSAKGQEVTFTDRPAEVLKFLQDNFENKSRTHIDTLAEVTFDRESPPVTPGGDETRLGTWLTGLGALGLLLAFIAFNSSSTFVVALSSLLVGGAGFALMKRGEAKKKQALQPSGQG
jgi:hypothetical protein